MSDEPQYPSEPLPSRDSIKESVAKLFAEVGAQNLTRRVLTKRLTVEYKIDFSAHRKLLDELVMEKIQEPEMKKQVAKAAKKHQEGPTRGGTKKAAKKKDGKDEKKKGKREKQEGEPTRALSAYFFFSNDKRPALIEAMKADGGKVNVSAIGSKIGEMWGQLSAEDKAPYEAKAAADKERYEKEKEAWIAAGGGGKKDKPREGPKRPMNASFLYVNAKREEYRKANPEAKLGEVTKALSDQFKALSDEARKEWDDKAAADKARYERELAEAKK
eukprot:CAMPEP_0174831768 /NCGR_PEP_ID=MMETSP1114-20130205/3291_1 /TAXON_ID=312471 /ORGANISM="Neobodo designis, Strain CCAP 1951/1" /LENGTH=272 /DNA_ID=CAMNT_0016065609 /DNA_START=33 /DNA_END=851 /DNA_ORIENTATION=+